MKKYDWFNEDGIKLKMPEKIREPGYFIEFKSKDSDRDQWTKHFTYYDLNDALMDIERLEKQNPKFLYRINKKT